MSSGRTKRLRLRRRSKLSPSTFSVSKLDFRPEFVNILKWLHKKSVGFTKGWISPAEFQVGNENEGESFAYRGICGNKKIRDEEHILFLPEELLITSHHFRGGLQSSGLTLHEKFVLFLLEKVGESQDSEYIHYLNTIPSIKEFASHPSNLPKQFWTTCLPHEIKLALEEQDKLIVSGYESINKFLSPGFVNFQNYKWLWLVVNTRTVFYQNVNSGEKEMALAPFLDLINHSPTPNTRVEFVGESGQRGYLITAKGDIENREQVFISYGSHPNCKLWLDYGFIPFQSNPEDLIPIDYFHLVKNCRELSPLEKDLRKRAVVEKYGLSQELHLMESDISPNLALIVSIVLWDPEKGSFDFQTDSKVIKELVIKVIQFKLSEYNACLENILRLGENSIELKSVLDIGETHITKSLKLMTNLRNNFGADPVVSSVNSELLSPGSNQFGERGDKVT